MALLNPGIDAPVTTKITGVRIASRCAHACLPAPIVPKAPLGPACRRGASKTAQSFTRNPS